MKKGDEDDYSTYQKVYNMDEERKRENAIDNPLKAYDHLPRGSPKRKGLSLSTGVVTKSQRKKKGNEGIVERIKVRICGITPISNALLLLFFFYPYR